MSRESVVNSRLGARLAAPSMVFGSGFLGGLYVGWRFGIPFLTRRVEWSIGLYEGPTPLELHPQEGLGRPLLTRHDIVDASAISVAEPFVFRGEDHWHLFFEIVLAADRHGVVGLASSSDGRNWHYRQIVLDEPERLSYPYVFASGGEHFMIPNTHESGDVRLYRAVHFPDRWEYEATLLDYAGTGATVFQHGDRWWMFVGRGSETLELLSAVDVRGPWTLHPASPVVVGDPGRARPAGRVVRFGDDLIRYSKGGPSYRGSEVNAQRITTLTLDEYAEEPYASGPILAGSGEGWNALGMHHCDVSPVEPDRWLALVDGQQETITVRWPGLARLRKLARRPG